MVKNTVFIYLFYLIEYLCVFTFTSETAAPIVPTLKDQCDVSYFDSFDENSENNGNTSGESRDEDQDDDPNGRAKNHWYF